MVNIELGKLELPWKVLISGFVITLGAGYLAAVANAVLSVGISAEKIADHYGDKSISSSEMARFEETGFIEEEFSLDDMEMEGHGAMAHESGDDTLPPQVLAQVSHVHLLSFSLLLLALGGLTCLSTWSENVKLLMVGALFVGFVADIGGLVLTRFVADGFAWMTLIAGTVVGVCIAVMSLKILHDTWMSGKT